MAIRRVVVAAPSIAGRTALARPQPAAARAARVARYDVVSTGSASRGSPAGAGRRRRSRHARVGAGEGRCTRSPRAAAAAAPTSAAGRGGAPCGRNARRRRRRRPRDGGPRAPRLRSQRRRGIVLHRRRRHPRPARRRRATRAAGGWPARRDARGRGGSGRRLRSACHERRRARGSGARDATGTSRSPTACLQRITLADAGRLPKGVQAPPVRLDVSASTRRGRARMPSGRPRCGLRARACDRPCAGGT